jgi:hypothetical protein
MNGLIGISPEDQDIIFEWLSNQSLLAMDILFKLQPLTDCPSNWPFGWKIALQSFIYIEIKRGKCIRIIAFAKIFTPISPH